MDEIDFLQCLKKIEKWFIFQIRSEFFPGYIMRREIIGSIVVTVVTSIYHIPVCLRHHVNTIKLGAYKGQS